MTHTDLLKQTAQSGRLVFETNFNAAQSLQDQAEKMVSSWLDQSPWINQEARSTLDKWAETCRNGQKQAKTTIDTNFNTLEGFLSVS
jgi:hypothetical protein